MIKNFNFKFCTILGEKVNTNVEINNRKNYLDVLKVLAMFFVVFYHSFGELIILQNNSTISQNIYYLFCSFITICVPIFFMVNGAILLNKPLDIKKHYFKTFKTFILVYFWSFIISIFKIPVCVGGGR